MDDEILIIVAIITLLIVVVVQLLYLMTLNHTIQAIRPEFRQIEPGQAWLGFIPLFHLIWPFIINPKVAASIKADLEDRGVTGLGEAGKQLGSIYPGLRFGGYIPGIGVLFSLGYLVVFIIWWSKLGQYKRQLMNSGTNSRPDLLDN